MDLFPSTQNNPFILMVQTMLIMVQLPQQTGSHSEGSSLRMEMKELILQGLDSNSEQLQLVQHSDLRVKLESLSYQFTMVVDTSNLLVKVLRLILRTMSVKVLYSDLFLPPNLLLSGVILLHYSDLLVKLPRRIQKFTLEQVLYSHLSARQNLQELPKNPNPRNCLQLLEKQKYLSDTIKLVLDLYSVLQAPLMQRKSYLITTKTLLSMLNMKITDSLLQQRQMRRLAIMLTNRLVIMQMR